MLNCKFPKKYQFQLDLFPGTTKSPLQVLLNCVDKFHAMYLIARNDCIFDCCLGRLYLHEATLRMMAGASPNKTQQLLDKSASSVKTNGSRGLVCGRDKDVYVGEREHALALILACKHLPAPLLSSPAETTGNNAVLEYCEPQQSSFIQEC